MGDNLCYFMFAVLLNNSLLESVLIQKEKNALRRNKLFPFRENSFLKGAASIWVECPHPTPTPESEIVSMSLKIWIKSENRLHQDNNTH